MHEERAVHGGGDEDGGVADGRGVVAEDRAAETGGDGRDEVVAVVAAADADGDGDEQREGAPRGAGGEGERHAHEKDHRRDHLRRDLGVFDELANVGTGLQEVAAGAADGPGEDEDDERGEHGLHALDDVVHPLVERHQFARHVEQQRREERHEARVEKRLRGVARAQNVHQTSASGSLGLSEGVHEVDGQKHHDHDGQQQVPHFALARLLRLFERRCCGGGDVFVGFGETQLRVVFVELHFAVVEIEGNRNQKEHEAQNAVDVERNRAQKHQEGVVEAVVLDLRHDGRCPGCQRNHDAHIGRHGVNNVGSFGLGHVVPLCDWMHNCTSRNRIEIIIQEEH